MKGISRTVPLLWVLVNYACLTQCAVVHIENHDENLLVQDVLNVTLRIRGTLTSTVTLRAVYDPPQSRQLLEPIPDIVIHPEQSNSDVILPITGRQAGHVTVLWNASQPVLNATDAFVRIDIAKSSFVNAICVIVGWMYFAAWSLSFWPQVYENYARKSVIGLNFDFIAINLLGHALYGIFNFGLYWSPSVQADYFKAHPMGILPVQANDVGFSMHATILTLFTAIQCCIYERGDQTVTWPGMGFIIVSCLFLLSCAISALASALTWLDVLNFCAYVKLTATVIKYMPQAYMNYKRKSTEGWSIGNILLDFTGGVGSILQMFLLSHNYDDWGSIFGDFTKFGLGVVSILYDILFIVQHYVLYRASPKAGFQEVPQTA